MTDLVAPESRDLPGFERQVAQLRPELTAYCYRMLGSAFEAEDAVQETMVRAWRGLDRFEGRSALRSWLYRIATNVCLDMLRGRGRRAMPMDMGPSSPSDARRGPALPEATWIRPIPDSRIGLDGEGDPADVTVSRETVRLAFVAALQYLPPRQRATLILRDVLRWRANEVAPLLDTTEVAVNRLLSRARSTMASHEVTADATGQVEALDDQEQQELLARYIDAFERFDVEALVALLHEDATISMPPAELWLQGRDVFGAWLRANHLPGRETVRCVPVGVNGSVGLAVYRADQPEGPFEALAIKVVEVSGERIAAIHAFLDADLFPLFDLPSTLAR